MALKISQLLLLVVVLGCFSVASAGHGRHLFTRRVACPSVTIEGECLSESECGSDSDCDAEYPGEGLACCQNSCNQGYCSDGTKRKRRTLVTRASCPAITVGECLAASECGTTADCDAEFPGEGFVCCPDYCGKRYCANAAEKRSRG